MATQLKAMLIVGFGIIGFCDIITLFRPIYAQNKHIMACSSFYNTTIVSKRRWGLQFTWHHLVAESQDFCRVLSRVHKPMKRDGMWKEWLRQGFISSYRVFLSDFRHFLNRNRHFRTEINRKSVFIFEWQRQKLEFTGFKGYAIARERHLLTEKISI